QGDTRAIPQNRQGSAIPSSIDHHRGATVTRDDVELRGRGGVSTGRADDGDARTGNRHPPYFTLPDPRQIGPRGIGHDETASSTDGGRRGTHRETNPNLRLAVDLGGSYRGRRRSWCSRSPGRRATTDHQPRRCPRGDEHAPPPHHI